MRLPSRFLVAAAALAALPAFAQSAIDENALRAFVSQQVAAQGQLTRFEVQLGTIDTQALAPCRRSEPFLPPYARLAGRSSVGVRCVDGANWTVLVPLTVRGFGRALVAAVPLAAGTVPGAQDVREQEVELTRENGQVLQEAAQLQGRTLTRQVAAGAVLRADMLRATQVVQAGDMVRLRIVGTGFMVTATGQALTAAADGQAVRVRTELGKILTGSAREGRVVEVPL